MRIVTGTVALAWLFASLGAHADGAAEMARKLQDPLANIQCAIP